MFRLCLLSMRLAIRDWIKESSLSFCGVLALASMLTPLLVLHGVHMGVIERLRENLLRDPAVLVIIPAGSRGAGFEEAFINEVSAQPGCVFSIGRTRDVASEVQLVSGEGARVTVTLEASAEGDPIFSRYGIKAPGASADTFEVVLTATAAKKLRVSQGGELSATLGHRLASGKFQQKKLTFMVKDVLPKEAYGMDTGFVEMNLLTAIQDFRDGVTSPLLQAEGDFPPTAVRHFESFRAYAASLDDVERLEQWFIAQDVPVKTRSRDIANIKNIDSTIASVIMLIAISTCAGFFAFMASTAQAAVRRKWKLMGMLRLIGFTRSSLLAYPVLQALATGGSGCFLAFGFYGIVAFAIDMIFSERTGGEAICLVPASFLCLTFLCVQALSVLASLRAAMRASSVEPSAVIREL